MWLIFSIISCILASIMQIFNKKVLNEVDPLVTTYLKNCFVFFLSFGLLFFNDTIVKINTLSKKTIFEIIILAIITFLTYLFFYLALRSGKLGKVLAIDRFSIVIVFLFLLIFNQEKITWMGMLGSIFVFIGILLITLK